MAQFCATQQPRPSVPLPPEVARCSPRAPARRARGDAHARAQPARRRPAGRGARLHHACDRAPRAEMQAVRRRIRAHVDQHPHLRQQRDLLTSIPGIGDATRGAARRIRSDAASARPARRRPSASCHARVAPAPPCAVARASRARAPPSQPCISSAHRLRCTIAALHAPHQPAHRR